MNILLDENKKQKAVKFISLNSRNWSYIFELFKDEIFEMIELKVPKTVIVRCLSNELNANIKYTTFDSWLRKRKNQNSNLKNNSQAKKEEVKKEVKQEPRQNGTKKEDEDEKDDEPWWEKRLRESLEGMKKADLRI